MPKKLSYFVTVIFLSACFSLLFWYLSPASQKSLSYISPLPELFGFSKVNHRHFFNVWFPELTRQALGSEIASPSLTAESSLVYDLTENKVLFEKNPKTRLPMASLTKMMTAIVSLENKKNDDRYIVHDADLVGEDSMGLSSGEVLSQEELLYGLLLNSGNDAAEVLASNFPGGRNAFIQTMNDTAKAMGLQDTNFTNPTGLEGDGDQHTTAYDLLVISRFALNTFPTFGQIAQTYEKQIPQTDTHKAYDIFNETNLLTTYPGVKGLKTGYTPEAGYCLVTYLVYENHQIIGIILNSQDRRNEMKQLLDYSLRIDGMNPPLHS